MLWRLRPLEQHEAVVAARVARPGFPAAMQQHRTALPAWGFRTALLEAAAEGQSERVLAILAEHPTAANAKDGDGRIALHKAAEEGHATICSAILDHHTFTEANARGNGGMTALHLAAANGHFAATFVNRARDLGTHNGTCEIDPR